MGTLIAGISLWIIAHLIPSVTPGLRDAMQAKLGTGARGVMALLILAALALIVIGWRSIVPQMVYDPPVWGRHLNMLLMYVAIYLLGAAKGAGRIRQWIRHPMLTGVIVWSIGHLFSNGEDRSVLLFGAMALWALVSIFTISAREGAWVKPAQVASIGREGASLVIAAIVYAGLMFGHGYFTGVPLLPMG